MSTPWTVQMFCDGTGIVQAAEFASEAAARELFDALTNAAAGERHGFVDERGYEFRLYPDRYTFILMPPQIRAGVEAARRVQQDGGLVLGGKSSH